MPLLSFRLSLAVKSARRSHCLGPPVILSSFSFSYPYKSTVCQQRDGTLPIFFSSLSSILLSKRGVSTQALRGQSPLSRSRAFLSSPYLHPCGSASLRSLSIFVTMVHCCPCKIGPSLLACDLANLASEAQKVMDAGADYLHVDVMDGHFVPNISWGPPVIQSLRKHSSAFFDVHMMVSKPEQWVGPMKEAGADQFTFHLESTEDPEGLIKMIREAGMKVGMAIKPGTPVEALYPCAEMVDMLLVMTVEPGFGGQKFMADMMPKVKTLRAKYPTKDIEVDGGLGPSTIDEAARAGANMIVAGSSVYKAKDPNKVITELRRSVERYGQGKQEGQLTPLPDGT